MSKVEEFYRALVKDPDLDVKAGQTREQAARMEANYRARQYDNNTKALALATEPEESPINSLLNHVQQMSKAYSEVVLIKAKKDVDDETESLKKLEELNTALNHFIDAKAEHVNNPPEGEFGDTDAEIEAQMEKHGKIVDEYDKLLNSIEDRIKNEEDKPNSTNGIKGLKFQNKNISDQFSSDGTPTNGLDFKEIDEHFMIGAGRGYFEEQEPDKYNKDNPLTTQRLKELFDKATGVQDAQTADLYETSTPEETGTVVGGFVSQTKKVGGGEKSGIFANKTMSDIKNLKPKVPVEGEDIPERGKPDIKSMRELANSYEKKYNRDIRAELGLDENGQQVDNWEEKFRYNDSLYSFLEGDIQEGTGVFHHDKKPIKVGKKNVEPQATHKNKGMHWNASAFKEGKDGMTKDGLRNFNDVLESVHKIVGNWDEHVKNLPTETEVAVENSKDTQKKITEYPKEYLDAVKNVSEDVHTNLTNLIDEREAKATAIDDAAKELADFESTRPKGAPIDWTDAQREEWGYKITRSPEKPGIPAQDVTDETGEGKQQELEKLKDAFDKAVLASKTHENKINELVEIARPEGIPRWNAGNWEQALEIDTAQQAGQEQDKKSGSLTATEAAEQRKIEQSKRKSSTKKEGTSAMDDIKKYMAGQGYKKKDINRMEKDGQFHYRNDTSQPPLSPENIEKMHNEGEFNKYFAEKKITPQGKAAEVKSDADAEAEAEADAKAKAEEEAKAKAKEEAKANQDNKDTDAEAEQKAMREEVDKLMDTHKKIIEHMYQDRYGKDNGVISLDRFKEKLKDKWYKSGFDTAEEDIAAGFKSKTTFDEKTAQNEKIADEKRAKDEKAEQDKKDRDKERKAKAAKQEEDKLQRERDRKQKEDERLRQREAKMQDAQDKKDANVLPHSFDKVDLSDRFSWNKQQQDLGIDKISKEEATHLARQLMSHKEFHKDRMNGKTSEQLDHAIFLLGKKGANLKGLKKEQEKMGSKFGTREHLQSTKDDLTHSQNHKAAVKGNDEHSRNQRAEATADKVKDTPKTEDEKTARIKQLQEEGKYPDMDVARQKIADGWEYSFDTQQWHMTDWKKQQQARMKGTNAATLSHGTHQHNGKDAHQTWDAASKSFKPSKDSFTIDGNGKMHAVTDGSSPTGGPASSRKISGDALNHSLSNSGYKVGKNNTQRTVDNFYPHAQHIGDTSVKGTGLERAASKVAGAFRTPSAKRSYDIGYQIGRNPASAVSAFMGKVKSAITGNTEKGYYMSSDNPLDSLLQKNPETISKQRQEILKRLSEK